MATLVYFWQFWVALIVLVAAGLYFVNRFRFRRTFFYGQSTVKHDDVTLYSNTTFEKLALQAHDKPASGDTVQFVGRVRLLDKNQVLLYRLLQVAFQGHDVFCRIRLGDILRPAPHYDKSKRVAAYRNISHLYVDAVVCDKQSRIIGVIDFIKSKEANRRRELIEKYKMKCLGQEQFSYLRIDPANIPRYNIIREMILTQKPQIKEDYHHTSIFERTENMTVSLISRIKLARLQKQRGAAPVSNENFSKPNLDQAA